MTENVEDDKDEISSSPKRPYSRPKTRLSSALPDELADEGSDNNKLKKKAKIKEETDDDEDIPLITKTPQKLVEPTIDEIAVYYEEIIRAGANATLLMTTLLNDTELLVEIVQGKRHSIESDIGDIATRVQKARWYNVVDRAIKVFYGDNVQILPIYNYLPPTLNNIKIERVYKQFST